MYRHSSASSSNLIHPNPMATFVFIALTLVVQLSQCIKLSVGVEHDMSGPTYGLEGKTSSQINYDDRNGLTLGGTISDILGPPIKIANGLGNVFHGSNMAGLGASLRGGGALLGFDAKLLETAGAGNLIKGGLLLNGINAKTNAAAQVAGAKGQKIASIIEVPVKVVAMKDVTAGKALSGLGQFKMAQAHSVDEKGQALLNQGQALKSQGIQQIVSGANEGVQNIGNMIQKTSENVNSAVRLLPIIWDMQQQDAAKNGQQHQQQQQQIQQQQQQLISTPHQLGVFGSQHSGPGALTGGSLFGGLGSLLPMLGGAPGFGAQGPNHGYAALWNATSPLTNLLMNPGLNPLLLPLTSGPFGQAIAAKQPIGTSESANSNVKSGELTGQGLSFNYDLFPGLKYSEHISSNFMQPNRLRSNLNSAAKGQQQQQQQQQQSQQIVQQEHQLEQKTKP